MEILAGGGWVAVMVAVNVRVMVAVNVRVMVAVNVVEVVEERQRD